ncbi:MAG: hypothetical protein H6R19_3007 [Proteobacteria bacterium]|nr:hypothetical protein [Pseudomonadota bacterium]
MNTTTTNCLTETDRYGDEVLNANWLPHMILSALGLPLERRQGTLPAQVDSEHEAEDFMQRLYRAQE